MDELERMNIDTTVNINCCNNIEKKCIQNLDNDNEDTYEKVKKFIDKTKTHEKIEIFDFNLYKKIKNDNQISPIMIYILERAIDKYNDDSIDNGIERVGTGFIPGITSEDKSNFDIYFNSKKAIVLYAVFSENFIGDFWKNHPLLSDLLGVNPDKTVLTSELKLGQSILSESKSTKSNKSKESGINKNVENNNPDNADSTSNENKIIEKSNNKKYYRLSLGASFEYNALSFLLYGIKKYQNLPRIIYFPFVKFIDYEEIDNAIIIEEMKPNLDKYYSNFKSIDLDNFISTNKVFKLDQNSVVEYNKNRKEFKLNENDLVFIETTFEFESNKNKVDKFFQKIIKFISLYIDIGLIKNLSDYTIKPIMLYNNDYYLNKTNLSAIKTAIEAIKIQIPKIEDTKLDKKKLAEIYNNLQIIYCWPTIPIFNNYTTYNDLNEKIDEYKEEIQKYKEEIEKYKTKIEKNENDIQDLKEIIEKMKAKNDNKYYNSFYSKKVNKSYYNNYKYNNYKPNFYKRQNYKYKYSYNYNINNENYKKYGNHNNKYYYNNNY